MDPTSQRNIDVLREAVEHFNRHGEPAWELIDPEMTFVTRGDVEGSSTYAGVEGFRAALSAFREVWDQITWEILDVVESGDVLAVSFRFHTRGRGSGVELDVDETWAIWMRRGKFLRIEQHGTRAAGLAAAGMSPWVAPPVARVPGRPHQS